MSTTNAVLPSATDSRPLADRVAVVTGATSGIGAATAQRLSAAGARVALVGRRAGRLEDLAARLGGDDVLALAADMTEADDVQRMAREVRGTFGRVDLVVANAGVMLGAPYETADTAEWDRMIDVNVRGLLRTGRAFVDDLLAAAAEGGRADLVHVGSVGSHLTFPNYGVYAATKAAVAHLTRNLRSELGPRGVRVKAVEPGVVATELGDGMTDATGREMLDTMRRQLTPLAPDEIADAIAYAAALPPNVNVAELIVVPTAQG